MYIYIYIFLCHKTNQWQKHKIAKKFVHEGGAAPQWLNYGINISQDWYDFEQYISPSRGSLNIRILFTSEDPHGKVKIVLWLSYLYRGNPIPGKTVFILNQCPAYLLGYLL